MNRGRGRRCLRAVDLFEETCWPPFSLPCQTADFSAAIVSMLRPLNTETSSRLPEIVLALPLVLRKSHFLFSSLLSSRCSDHSPFNFSPLRKIDIDLLQ